jgi:hypothetical protein
MIRPPADRRTRTRFEAFGACWGTLDAGEPVRVRNLTRHGALIEAEQPLAIDSIQPVCLMLDGQRATADARVRHFEPAGNPEDHHYLVGVEFVSMSNAFADAVERLTA